MPSLLAGALGAVPGRLDDIREAIEFVSEREESDEDHPEPEERMDPYIGENYLVTHPGNKTKSSKQDYTLS
jgi:hypothetical protein